MSGLIQHPYREGLAAPELPRLSAWRRFWCRRGWHKWKYIFPPPPPAGVAEMSAWLKWFIDPDRIFEECSCGLSRYRRRWVLPGERDTHARAAAWVAGRVIPLLPDNRPKPTRIPGAGTPRAS